jgi:hypothetical protein
MKFSPRSLLTGVLLVIAFGGYSIANPAKDLPKSDKVEATNLPKSNKVEKRKDETLPIKLEIKESGTNPKLEKGKGCADIKNLQEVKGETFVDYPMAETIPCTEVDCKDLEPAKLYENNYKELPTAKTDLACEE